MKRLFTVLLLLFSIWIGVRAFRVLPADNSEKVRVKYESWAGVVRIWVCEDWQVGTGSIARWLNACAELFEKSHNGVYINVQLVSADAVRNFLTTGINPPDIIVYPPALLPSADGLRAFSLNATFRPGMEAIGAYEDARYAAPVLMNAHLWVYSASAFKHPPPDLYDVAAACRESDLPALVALNSGLRAAEGESRALPGVDIGLSGGAAATPEPAGSVACRVGADFMVSDDARALFSSGEVSMVLADLKDLSRITSKTEWQTAVTGTSSYIDDYALCSIVSRDDAHADARAALAEQYIALLLSDGQPLAARAGALPVVADAIAYSGDILYSAIEAGLENKRIVCAPAFGAPPDHAAARAYLEGRLTADEALTQIVAGW
ncbi:MAG: hypothetical protein ACOYI5_10995 [Christensenellales bacterium]